MDPRPLLLTLALLLAAPGAMAQTWTGSITITGEDDMVPDNGVTEGTGTAEDPYVIGPWDFQDPHRSTVLEISSVDAHVLIKGITYEAGEDDRARYGIHVRGVTHLTIEDVMMTGVRSLQPTEEAAVRVDRAETVLMKNVTAHATDGSGIWIHEAGLAELEDLKATSIEGYGIWVDQVRSGYLHGAIIEDIAANGLYLCDTDDIEVKDVVIKRTGDMGIDLADSHRNVIRDSHVEGAKRNGLMVISSHENWFEGNTFVDNGRAGIFLVRSRDNVGFDNVFEGNRVEVEGGELLPDPSPKQPVPGPAAALVGLAVVAALFGRRDHVG